MCLKKKDEMKICIFFVSFFCNNVHIKNKCSLKKLAYVSANTFSVNKCSLKKTGLCFREHVN